MYTWKKVDQPVFFFKWFRFDVLVTNYQLPFSLNVFVKWNNALLGTGKEDYHRKIKVWEFSHLKLPFIKIVIELSNHITKFQSWPTRILPGRRLIFVSIICHHSRDKWASNCFNVFWRWLQTLHSLTELVTQMLYRLQIWTACLPRKIIDG